jgi:ATP-dependent protease ClpP protease subunit
MTPFRIQAKAASAPPEGPDVTVEIMDEIGWGSGSAQEFIGAMQAAKAQRPLVRIHSRGGDVLDSLAIRSFLASLDTTVEIFGVAASAASYIATAGRKVRIVENGFVMVHAPWGATMGTSSDMRETADLLDKMETTYVSGYRQKTGKDEATVRGWMAKDTWMTAQEAKDAGLVDEILPPVTFSASASIRAMASIPKALVAVDRTAPEAARNAFDKGVRQVEQGLGGDGLEPTTVKEARSLKAGEAPTEFKIRKANAWWGRNERFLEAEADSPADVSANLWGGAAGRDWFRALYAELERDEDADREASATLDVAKTAASTTKQTMNKTAKLLALLGVQPAAEDVFLASAIADLGVTPEAVTEARKSGSTDFLATHIKDRIAAADATAKAATDRANAILAAVGVKPDAPDIAAEVAKAIDAKASAKAADILAAKGINTDVGNAKAATGADKTKDEIVAEFNAMKPGPERSAFFAKHRKTILS